MESRDEITAYIRERAAEIAENGRRTAHPAHASELDFAAYLIRTIAAEIDAKALLARILTAA